MDESEREADIANLGQQLSTLETKRADLAEECVRLPAWTELRADITAIERTFPELKLPKTRSTVAKSLKRATQRGRQMSAAARKAVSARMKACWAKRRKAKK